MQVFLKTKKKNIQLFFDNHTITILVYYRCIIWWYFEAKEFLNHISYHYCSARKIFLFCWNSSMHINKKDLIKV